MKLPWQDKTGIPKAMAILATTAIVAFGLCTANVVMGAPDLDSRWLQPLQYLIPLCSITVVVSVLALLILFGLNHGSSKKKP